MTPAPRHSLYKITAEIQRYHEAREQAEYEGDSEAVAAIDLGMQEYIKANLPAKVDGIRGYLKAQALAASVYEKEADELYGLAKRAKANVDRVKGYVLGCMAAAGVTKLAGSLHWIRRQANGGVRPLEIRQRELVPDEMTEVEISMPTRTWAQIRELLPQGWFSDGGILPNVSVKHLGPAAWMIRAALERGDSVPGCQLGDRGEHVRTD